VQIPEPTRKDGRGAATWMRGSGERREKRERERARESKVEHWEKRNGRLAVL
jgi:hypothetical protein